MTGTDWQLWFKKWFKILVNKKSVPVIFEPPCVTYGFEI